ncbi:MAG: hypothetical protein RIR12_291 [Bacteroidota bacterium]|jgi:hypothetical protein
MSNENEDFKPLSFDDDENFKPLSSDDYFKKNENFVPISNPNINSNELTSKDSNFVFFFGISGTGKSVILSAILYYLRTKAGVLRTKPGSPNSKEAQVLLADFFENISMGILPSRTARDQVTRMDFIFEPNNKSKKIHPINLTFLEIAGQNLQEITRGGNYHSKIEVYLNAKVRLNIIIVTSYDTAHKDDSIINEFFCDLERRGYSLKELDVLLVVSKWDMSGRTDVSTEEELENFVQQRLPMTNNVINSYELSKTFFTIGNIEKTPNSEKITLLNLSSAEIISKWLYETIVGYPLDYEGTFWERIKFSF